MPQGCGHYLQGMDMECKRNRGMSWAAALVFLFATGCTATRTVEAETPSPQEAVATADTTKADAAPAAPAPEAPKRHAEGALGDDADCLRLIANGEILHDADAQKAWKLYADGKYADAAPLLAKYAADTNRSADDRQLLYFLAALAQQKRKNADEATALMKRAWEIDAPLRHIAAVYGTRIGYGATKWDDIVDFTDSLLGSEEFRTYRAIALANLGRYDAAASEFERIEKFPKAIRLDALDARARAQFETVQLKAALETYRRIYELDPKSPQGQMAQEAILAQKDKWPAGFTFPRAAQESAKSKSEREIANGHFNAHRSEQAIAAYTKLLKADKKSKNVEYICEDLYAIARSHVKLRAHTKSMPFFREALGTCKKSESYIKILYSAGKAAWNAGEDAQAIAWYQEIIDSFATHSYADDAYHYQAQILAGEGKTDEAREKLRAQIAAYPNGDMAKDAYWMLMSDLYERGQYQEAIDFVTQNLANAGESDLYTQGRLEYFQGRAYEKIGDTPSALRNYLLLLEKYPLSYFAMLSLGRIQTMDPGQADAWIATNRPGAFKPEQAMDYCFQVIPDDPAFLAARTLARIGLYDDALAEIDPIQNGTDPHATYEARLARSILLQKAGRYSDSARLAAGLLNPVQDIVYQSYAPWLLAYPKPWSAIVSASAEPESTLYYSTYAIMREESYYNPKAESWANARGLMQLMLPTAQSTSADIGKTKPTAADLFKPEISIPIGSAYIAKLMRILVPHPMVYLPGYNAGQGNLGKWLTRFADLEVDMYVEKIPYKEARHYAKRVGTTLWRYRWLYDENLPRLFDPAEKVGDLKKGSE